MVRVREIIRRTGSVSSTTTTRGRDTRGEPDTVYALEGGCGRIYAPDGSA
jgi:hypothetical protein